MKLASFEWQGLATWGAVTDQGVKVLATPRIPSLKAALADGTLAEALARADTVEVAAGLDEVTWLPVIPDPGSIFCVGVNYEEHRQETLNKKVGHPTIFLRLAGSQVGHGQPILLPPESSQLDYEGEIAVIIGKGGRRIAQQDAWEHVAGYAAYNDGSIRDWQRHTSQWAPGKNFASTGAFGPCMVTRGDIGDGEILTLETRLNGDVMQHATTDMMLFSIPEQIAYISSFIPLQPGDVIVTGTPGGVGNKRNPQVFMKPGDVCEIEVDAVGVLRNGIRDE